MSSTWLEAAETDDAEFYGGDEGAEGYGEAMNGDGEAFGEGYDDAEARLPLRRRRARARRLARARRRAALARRGGYGGRALRSATAAVADLEVESRVQADMTEGALAAHRRQIRAGTTAAAASAVVPSLLSFLQTSVPDVGSNRYFRAGLPLAPLLFLRPMDRGLSDRRLWAAAAVAGLVVAEDVKSKGQVPETLSIDRSMDQIPQKAVVPFRAVALDRRRNPVAIPLGAKIEWESTNTRDVYVDPSTGEVEAKGTPGSVATIKAVLTAPDGRVLDSDFITVKVI